jgi:hypothetical protein
VAKASPFHLFVWGPEIAAQKRWAVAGLQSPPLRLVFPMPKHGSGLPIGTGFTYSAVAVRVRSNVSIPNTLRKKVGTVVARVTSSLLSASD